MSSTKQAEAAKSAAEVNNFRLAAATAHSTVAPPAPSIALPTKPGAAATSSMPVAKLKRKPKAEAGKGGVKRLASSGDGAADKAPAAKPLEADLLPASLGLGGLVGYGSDSSDGS